MIVLLLAQNTRHWLYIKCFFKHRPLRKIVETAICLALSVTAYAQDANTYYNQGLEKAQARQFKEAIELFDKAIGLNPGLAAAWANRGYSKMYLKDYKAAIADFNEAIRMDASDKAAWLNRGATKFQIADYNGALSDLDYAISLDTNLARAYYARGFTNEKLGKTDAACADFKTALQFGIASVQQKVDECNGKKTTMSGQPGFTVLDKEKNKEKLLAIPPQLFIKAKDTAWGITFFLMRSPDNDNTTGSFDASVKSDSLASIEIVLQNGEILSFKNSPHGQGGSGNQPLLFMAIIDRRQKDLLLENNIKKISFHVSDEHYEYLIKDKYAGRLKDVLR